MKKIIILLILALLFACGTVIKVRNYYVLFYNPIAQNAKLILDQPLPYTIEIADSKVPKTYDKYQMVVRRSAHRINYSNTDLWAVRVSDSVPDLLNNHINRYNIFTRCQREYLDEKPDLELVTYIKQIEMFKNKKYQSVHLQMEYSLRKVGQEKPIVNHSVDIEQEITPTNDMDIFARKISDMLKKSTDEFLVKTIEFFEKNE